MTGRKSDQLRSHLSRVSQLMLQNHFAWTMVWHTGWVAKTSTEAYKLAAIAGICHCHSEKEELHELTNTE